jgi:DNA-binding transcriptional regulator YdaS (Cro superfamily)
MLAMRRILATIRSAVVDKAGKLWLTSGMHITQVLQLPGFESFAALARITGVSREAARNWELIPPRRCPAIEAATAGKVTCEQLRPDLEWHQLPDGRKVAVGEAPAKPSTRKRAA